MKSTNFKGRKSGFTLAELLMVIAILVILVGLGVTGFLALRRSIRIAKYDDLAREIYVAVQNQLTRLEANGLDEKMLEDLTTGVARVSDKPEDYDKDDAKWAVEKDNFYHADQGNAKVMALLLPLGAVADDVRSNGFYVVEYNVQTRTVYSVFYSEQSFEYSTVSAVGSFRTSRETRKAQKPMVGYYGGSSVERDDLETCPTPELQIINNNELRLNILNIPTDITGVTVTISDGENKVELLYGDPKIETLIGQVDAKTVLFDSILEPNKHFHELFPTLTPGKDLKITVTYSKPGCLSSSASVTANSLFATREPGKPEPDGSGVNLEDPGDTVTIAWARHLQNLENSHSGLNDEKITIARQTEHIEWGADEIHDDYKDFKSIQNTGANEKLLRYEGSGLEIRDLKGSNGLFAETKENMELSGIRVVNPVIDGTGSDPVGALVGTARKGTSIHLCAVYSSKINETTGTVEYSKYPECYVNGGTAVTGGLVGTADHITVTNSFAALPRIQASTGGTLIGSATNCTINNSYANCDNLPEAGTFAYFLRGEGNEITHCYAVGNVANEREEDGVFADGNNTVTDSYYAVSHREFAPDPKDNQDLAATEFSYIGNDGTWKETNQEGMTKDVLTGEWADMIAPLTHPYREYLDGRRYPYPAIGNLDHYGSWPDSDGTVDLTIDMRLLGKTGYAFYAGRVVVTNLDETDTTKQVLFDSRDHVKNNVFDGENTVKIVPGTNIQVKITTEDGYTYVSTDITGAQENYEETINHTVTKDTTVTVKYQQSTFKLTCAWPETEEGNTLNQKTYAADCDRMTLVPNNSGDVEVGSKVVVRITGAPNTYPTGNVVVWYTLDNDTANTRHYVQKVGDNYPFEMPSGNATIHVQHTKDTFNLHVNFFLREPVDNGQFVEQADKRIDTQYSAGTVIDQSLVEILADSSNLPLTLEDQNVLYLAKAILLSPSGKVDNEADYRFYSTSDDLGTVSYPTGKDAYISEKNDNLFLYIYIDRKQYDITLTKGVNINKVEFAPDGPATDGTTASVQKEKVYYGQKIEAVAEVIPGQVFTVWESSDHRFRMSSAPRYTFTMPHYDLTLTASADVGKYLVTLDLLENGESWLASSASRMADPITITLVSSKNPKEQYTMDCLTDENNSFIAQKIVPSIPDLGEGYRIRVNYQSGLETFITSGGAFYNPEGRTGDDRVLLTVRDRAVERELHFYSVTYHPNCKTYVGTVPTGGTYPEYFYLEVAGNPGLLRNKDTEANPYLCGWKDVYAGADDNDKALASGDRLMLTRRTDLFAQWGGKIRVIYRADEATGGIIPVDAAWYNPGENPAVKPGEPERAGYTFEGWIKDGDETTLYRADGENSHISIVGEDDVVTMTAKWKQDEYTLTYYTLVDGEWVPYGQPITGLHYGDKRSAIGMADTPTFLGWSETKNGDVRYRAGEPITITGNMSLYARTAAQTVKVTYHSTDGQTVYETKIFGKGIGAYLEAEQDGKPIQATAWSTEPYGKGTLYLCQETEPYRSLEPAAFAADINLYLVTGKIYNFNQRTWHDTLYEAKERAGSGDTLIVYRDTWEDYNVWINKDLYIIASGNRTIKWKDGATPVGSTTALKDETGKEFSGCMNVAEGKTVTFGKTDIATLSMNGSTLTFDANEQSRVIALEKATLNMYDGVTLTNGWRPESKSQWGNDGYGFHKASVRSYMGGGVYAGDGSTFNMYGGTISRCSAYCGGGVYLYTGSKMQMGNMETPTYYSSTAIYYTIDENTGEYVNVPTTPGPEDYKKYFVTTGNPQICYNTSTRTFGDSFNKADGGGGLLMLDLKDGDLILYRGSINNNHANANGGGIVTDGGISDTVSANNAKLRIYEVDISHNRADGYGGGIFQWQGIVSVYNSTIRQNYAELDGGGVYLHHWGSENSDVDFYYGDISGNRAEGKGGGVYIEKESDMWIRYGNLYGNSAGNKGGGVYLQTGDKLPHLYFHKGTIRDNRQNGGESSNDVYLAGSDTYMTVLETTDTQQGGLFLEQDEDTKIHVDCGNEGDGTEENGRIVVYYPNAADFKEQDTDFFVYDPNSETELLVTPVEPDHLKLVSEENLPRDVFFYPNYTNADGSEPEETKVETNVNATISYPPFTRDGYDLIGWAASPDANIEQYLVYRKGGIWYTEYDRANGLWKNPLVDVDGNPDPAGVPTYSVTSDYDQKLYAMWKPYTVTYHLRTTNAAVEIAQEESIGPKVRILSPTTQYTEGEITYTFIGWTAEENGNTPTYTDGQEITLTESMDLYAVWQPDKVNITFDFNNGMLVGGQTSQTKLVPREQELPIPELSITRAGYIHKGWSKVKDSSTVDYEIEGTVPADDLKEDLTLYAVWAEAVTVTFDCNGGESGGSQKLDKAIEKGSKITLDVTPTRENYDFLGWAETKEATEPAHKTGEEFGPVSANTTLYAVWRAKMTVTLMMNDGTETVFRETQESAGDRYTLPEPVRPGYTFLGWDSEATAETATYKAGEKIDITEERITLYALWQALTEDQWQLIFQLGNPNAVWTEPLQIVAGETESITIPTAVPTREGYVFDCWHDGENQKYQPDDQVAKPTKGTIITLTAQWTPAVTITFDLQGGTGAFATDIVGKDTEYTIPSTTPAKNGFEFRGWSTNSDGSGELLKAGENVEISENTTFYAIWEEATWTVSFGLNGASGEVPAAVIVPKGGSATLPTHPAREGYKFLGWAENANESDPDKLYHESYTPSANVTLYAIWQRVYTVTLDPNGGTWPGGSTEPRIFYANENDSFTIPKDMIPTQSGYSFFGWIEQRPTGETEYAHPHTFENMTDDLTLKAKWNEVWSNQVPPDPANSETQNADPPETEAPPTEASAKEDPAASDAPAQSETGASGAPTDGDPGEVSAQPEAQEDPAPPEEEPVWTVAFYLDGVDFVKHPQLFGEELQDCQWDEEEKWLIYTVPAGEEVTLLPPEVKLDGWIFDGWLLLDENEEIVYPAGGEIPLTDGMALVPLWKEPPPPPTETQAPPPPTQGEKTAAP